jgi:membrane fusion protein (multidrug efflux system)
MIFMSTPFSRTLRSLEADRHPRSKSSVALALLLLAWGVWFFLGRITVYEVSQTARLEVQYAVHPVAALVTGKVSSSRLTIGRRVNVGDLLVELDDRAVSRAVAERSSRRDALIARRFALQQETKAEKEALETQAKGRRAALAEANAQLDEAKIRTRLANAELRIMTPLRSKQAVSESEFLKIQAGAQIGQAQVNALSLSVTRLEQDRLALERERCSRLAKLERESVELEGEVAIEEASIRRLEHDLSLHSIRAPVDGFLGEAIDLNVGAVVRAADKLGSVVPEGQLRAVAMFPATAVGRVQPGQNARLRLEGFPWTQFGSLPATVSQVANEPSAGSIRVEFSLEPNSGTAIPLEHGLPGYAEVAIEQVSPAEAVLRAAGHFLTTRPSSAGPSEGRGQP